MSVNYQITKTHQYIIQNSINTHFPETDFRIFLHSNYHYPFTHLNSSLSFVSKEELPILISQTEQVLNGKIEFARFPLDPEIYGEVPFDAFVYPDVTFGIESNQKDPESVPTEDFLKILNFYLTEIQKFEKEQQILAEYYQTQSQNLDKNP